jgi:hypothetical protein
MIAALFHATMRRWRSSQSRQLPEQGLCIKAGKPHRFHHAVSHDQFVGRLDRLALQIARPFGNGLLGAQRASDRRPVYRKT